MGAKKNKNEATQQNDGDGVSYENSFYQLGLEQKIRETFRVPVDDDDSVKVIFSDIEFDVVNVATKGVGIRITKLDKFEVGEQLKPLRLIINDKTFRLEGEIVHITPENPDTSVCGIRFTNMQDSTVDMLLNYLQKYGSFDMDTVY